MPELTPERLDQIRHRVRTKLADHPLDLGAYGSDAIPTREHQWEVSQHQHSINPWDPRIMQCTGCGKVCLKGSPAHLLDKGGCYGPEGAPAVHPALSDLRDLLAELDRLSDKLEDTNKKLYKASCDAYWGGEP